VVSVVRVVNCRSRASIPVSISELVRLVAVLGASSRPVWLLGVSVTPIFCCIFFNGVVVSFLLTILQLLVDEPTHEIDRARAVSLSYGCLPRILGSCSSEVHSATACLIIYTALALRLGVLRLVEALVLLRSLILN